MGLFTNRPRVPVWFMRQAGRYHSHYQNIKKNADFMRMCKIPELACEVTLGPIQDFGFNAAILFSDLLFPLEHMGLGLVYNPGPQLAQHLKHTDDLARMAPTSAPRDFYQFQGEAVALLKKKLPAGTDLLGFVGGPFTLYTYAVEGSHAGNLVSSKQGLYDGRWQGFLKHLLPSLMEEMYVQAKAGADAICLFDTAAGELSPGDYAEHIVPVLKDIMANFKQHYPKTKIVYYSKHTQPQHLKHLISLPLDVVGIDWRCDLVEVQKMFPPSVFVQGNFDPVWLHLPQEIMLKKLKFWIDDLKIRGLDFNRWIAGLGHGVLIETPESNVRAAVKFLQSL